MARNKSDEEKQQLTKQTKVNKRPPIWAYLKTKNRGLMRERKRNWRFGRGVGRTLRTNKNKKQVKPRRGLDRTLRTTRHLDD